MNQMFYDLYYGRISAWERKPKYNAEEKAVNRKIEEEKRYFISKMSLDDVKRFEELSNLYVQSHEYSEIDNFHYGFKFATMLMCAVFMDENGLTND